MAKNRKSIKYRIEYVAMFLGIKLIRLMKREHAIAFTKWIAVMLYIMLKEHRETMIRNLSWALGNQRTDKEIRIIAREVYIHFAIALTDTIRIPNIIREGINRYVRAENIHILDNALSPGKGAILLTGHFGNWELMGAWVALRQYPKKVIGSHLKNPFLDKLIVDMRNTCGYRNIPRGKSAREIIRAINDGALLGMLIDQDIKKIKGVFVDFFGRKAHTPIGPVVLAAKYNLPIIPMFIHLEKDTTYRIECFDPIHLINTGDPDKDILINTQKCSDAYEKIIRRYPEQWAWFHKRWDRQPAKDDVFL